jgi:hypothetical protein
VNQDVLALLTYRLAVLACGFASIVMGYRLFRLGVFERAGELKATWGERSLLLKAAAPGTFFALFGSAIIAVTVWKGFTVETSRPLENSPIGFRSSVDGRKDSPEFQNAIQAAAAGRPLSDEQKALLASTLGLVEKRSVQAK